MSKKHTKSNADAFEDVFAHFIAMNGGKERGALSLMAKELGITRQGAEHMRGRGVRKKYLPKLRELTGMSYEDMIPNPFEEFGK